MEEKFGLIVCVLSMVFFRFVKTVLIFIGPPKSATKDQQKWNNICVSCIHALICSLCVICSFIFYPEKFTDLSSRGNAFIYYTVCMSVGYFIYDTIDMMLQNNTSTLLELMSHHAGVMTLLIHNIIMKICLPYVIVGLIAEFNSVFLHLRKLLQMANKHTHYQTVAMLNTSTFVVFRGAAIAWTTYAVLFHFYGKIPALSYIFIFVSTIVIDIANFIFFWKILKNDYLKTRTKCESITGICMNGHIKDV